MSIERDIIKADIIMVDIIKDIRNIIIDFTGNITMEGIIKEDNSKVGIIREDIIMEGIIINGIIMEGIIMVGIKDCLANLSTVNLNMANLSMASLNMVLDKVFPITFIKVIFLNFQSLFVVILFDSPIHSFNSMTTAFIDFY